MIIGRLRRCAGVSARVTAAIRSIPFSIYVARSLTRETLPLNRTRGRSDGYVILGHHTRINHQLMNEFTLLQPASPAHL